MELKIRSAHMLEKSDFFNNCEALRMDFNSRVLQVCPGNVPLPYFMTYPGYPKKEYEAALLQDMEYLQQMYPGTLKKYMSRVAEILDRVDYEGSMIYDEYPDRYSISNLADSIVRTMKQEAKNSGETYDEQQWDNMENLIQVLLCDEIYKRRHGGRRGILKF